MRTDWWVEGKDLEDRPRMGGAIAINGFEFQKTYALLRLAWLLTCRGGLVEVRYEGAQDVDLRDSKGQHFVQAKAHDDGGITLSVLYDAIAGFARDVVTARKLKCSDDELPSFRLVTTGIPVQSEPLELYRKVFLGKHESEIAKRIQPKYRSGLTDKAVLDCAKAALDRTTFESVPGEHAIEAMREQACWALAEFGVPVESVGASIAKMERLLLPRASLQSSDVVEVLEGLPPGHPGHPQAPCRLLPASSRRLGGDLLRTQFIHGTAPSLWSAAASGLAIQRSAHGTIERDLRQLTSSGGVILIEGAGGTGKSTLARQVAWSLHREGSFVVLDVATPASVDEAAWAAILRLCRVSARPLLLVVDDFWRHGGFVEELDRNVRRNLCVLATSRPGEKTEVELTRLVVATQPTGALHDEELAELAKLLGTESNRPRHSELHAQRLAQQGQIFALSLVLQSGSLEEFGKRLVAPLRASPAHLDGFLDLCAAGMHDQTVPLSLLAKRNPHGRFWRESSYEGLTFPHGRNVVDRLRAAHALIAEQVLLACDVDPVDRALALIKSCDPAAADERRFALRLLSSCTKDERTRGHCLQLAADISSCMASFELSSSYSDLHRRAEILTRLNRTGDALTAAALANAERIRDSEDVTLALARMDKDGYRRLFHTVFSFYERNATSRGRRRFLIATRRFGTDTQMLSVVEQTSIWLRRNHFPSNETQQLFDIGAYVSDHLAERISNDLIVDFSRAPEHSTQASLAAVRLLSRSKNRTCFLPLEQRLTAELAAVADWTTEQMFLARRLAVLSRKLYGTHGHALADILLRMADLPVERRLKIYALQSASYHASGEQVNRLRSAVLQLTNGMTDERSLQLRAQLTSRLASHPYPNGMPPLDPRASKTKTPTPPQIEPDDV